MAPDDIAWAIDAALEHAEKRTRRERIATAALQGLLATVESSHLGEVDAALHDFADSATKTADALIAELDKKP